MKNNRLLWVILLLSLGCIDSSRSSQNNQDSVLSYAKKAGGVDARAEKNRINSDAGKGIAAFADGSFIVTGQFMGTSIFGEGETNETTLVSSGTNDVFVAKYNSDGTLVFAKKAGGTAVDFANSVSVISDGSFFITGLFENSAVFGKGESNETTLIGSTKGDVFVAKYNVDGTLSFAKSAGGIGIVEGRSIATLEDGSIFITGRFSDISVFGKGETNETTLSAPVTQDMFLAKYNSDGSLAFAKRTQGVTGGSDGIGIVAMNDGSSIVVGAFAKTTTFGPGETNEITFSTVDNASDSFMAKYNTDGTLQYAKTVEGAGLNGASAISKFTDGSFVVTGQFVGIATFGKGESNETTLTLNNYSALDIFLAKYNNDGSLVFAKRGTDGYSSYDYSFGISTSADNTFFITGQFGLSSGTGHIPIIFGPNDPKPVSFYSSNHDIFLAKYNADGTLAAVERAGGLGSDKGTSVNSVNGTAYVTGHFEGTAVFGKDEQNETQLIANGIYDIFIAQYNQ